MRLEVLVIRADRIFAEQLANLCDSFLELGFTCVLRRLGCTGDELVGMTSCISYANSIPY